MIFGKLKIVGIAALALVASNAVTFQVGKFLGKRDAQQRIVMALQEERIAVLKKGQESDAEVDKADDDSLCDILGGCL